MSGLDAIVNVVLSSATQQVTRRGFGTPMILGCSNKFAEPCRTYTEPSEMVTDGFLVTDPEYLAAQAVKAQEPCPASFKVARRDNPPTLRWAFTPLAKNSTKYTLTVDGVDVEFTSDADASVAEIVAGLVAAGTLAAIPDITFSNVDDASVRITAGTAGRWHTVVLSLRDIARGLGNIAQDNADGGIATDLAALLLYDADWYGLVLAGSHSAAEITAAATWIESAERLMVAASQDSEIITHALAGATDIAAALATASRARTAVIYHPKCGQFAGAALQGRVLPLSPGSETWAYKTLSGVDICTEMTPTHITNALAKKANIYQSLGGLGVTRPGLVAANEWIDVIRFRDWLVARLQEDVFGSLVRSDKVPFTDKGISVVEKDIRSVLQEGVEVGGLEEQYSVTVPKSVDVSQSDKAARRLDDVRFQAYLAGAIHTLQINGVLTYQGT